MIRLRLFLCVIAALCMLSAGPQQFGYELEGVWIRIEDRYEGMRIQVYREEGKYMGRLLTVPPEAGSWGFKAGDIKWKDIDKYSESNYLYMDLTIRNAGSTVYTHYDEMHLEFLSADKIRTRDYVDNLMVGSDQTWVREPPM